MAGQDQDRGLGELLTHYPGRLESFDSVGRRHSDIDHHQLRDRLTDQLEELGAVACLAHNVEPGATEQAGHALAQQDVVLAQNHPRPSHLRGATGLWARAGPVVPTGKNSSGSSVRQTARERQFMSSLPFRWGSRPDDRTRRLTFRLSFTTQQPPWHDWSCGPHLSSGPTPIHLAG